jgi:hypothetical protein
MAPKKKRLITIDAHLDELAQKAFPSLSLWVENRLKMELDIDSYSDILLKERAHIDLELRKLDLLKPRIKNASNKNSDIDRISRYVEIVSLDNEGRLDKPTLQKLTKGIPYATGILGRFGTDKWHLVRDMLNREIDKSKEHIQKSE